MQGNIPLSRILIVSAGLALAVCAQQTLAQCDVYRLGIPDFDQRRSVLPNGGNAYCVPTAGMNWLAYISNHGFPNVLNGPRAWQSQANNGFVTDQLLELGSSDYMSTDPSDGTTWTDYQDGMQSWLDEAYPDAFVVSVAAANGQWVPTPNIVALLEAANCLVSIAHGRYRLDTCGTSPTQHVRTGGHAVTLARVYDACSASPEMWYRDPAGFDGDNLTQAPFVTQKSDYAEFASSFSVLECSPSPVARTMWRRVDPDPAVNSILDGYGWIIPLEGLTVDAESGTVSVVGTYDFDTFSVPARRAVQLPGKQTIVDFAYAAETPTPVVLSRSGVNSSDFNLWQSNYGVGAAAPVARFTTPMSMLVTGRRNDSYMWQQLTPTVGRIVRIDMGTGEIINSMSLTERPRAMAYDDAVDRLVIVTGDGRGIGSVSPTVDGYEDADLGRWTVNPLPGDVSMAPVSGRITGIAVDYAVCGEGIEGILLLSRVRGGGLEIAGQVRFTGLEVVSNVHVTPSGTLACLGDGSVRAVRYNIDRQTWLEASEFPLLGEKMGPIFALIDSRANAGEWFGTRADVNIVPPTDQGEPAPECAADFNGDRVVTSQDFFDFLRAFFESSPAADFDENGVLNSQDFFEFLRAFFAGC